ncbi:MAG TPA: DNA mismatch repair endonuclease MutL [Vicinamibacteria bacterium]|nr:DNA mismatch repair endonuclease MutL [Vicinamibacteria bacterium]
MPRVERLPDDLVNKIAAGEVVERPASVVKELVENALDAGASSVQVEIEGGGKRLIRVRDDGSGMAREDAERALERHATSKLHRMEDLHSLGTHGFRGEALPSIGSVSHLVLRTREESAASGTEIEVEHGRPRELREVGHPRGTTVEVRDLFGEVPARRKFLRADSTETSHLAETLTLLALARPQVSFRLASQGRALIQAPAAEDLRARAFQLFGARFIEDLVPVEGGADWARVRGLVSRPDHPGPARSNLRLFVNGRAVRDRALTKALAEAYRAASAGDRTYEAVLFLEAPLHLVDVNVHPAKAEVRFADMRTAFAAVQSAVREALSGAARGLPPAAYTRGVARAVARFLDGSGVVGEAAGSPYGSPGVADPARPQQRAGVVTEAQPDQALLAEAVGGAATVLGQHRNTYIVASDGLELLLVDQHTAHERIRFEALIEGLEQRTVASQGLLAPLVVNLPPALLAVIAEHAETLAALGYDIDDFGAGSVRVRAVPAVLGARDPGPGLLGVLQDLQEREAAEFLVSAPRERLAATLACHSAVRAGQPLSRETMAAIVGDLARTRHPTLCPHGRPTSVRIPRQDLSHWFGRTGWRRQ